MNRELIDIGTDSVVVKSRVRQDDGDLATLVNSIRKLGVLAPIIVDKNNVLITGGRRLEACRTAGVGTIPALRLDIDYDGMAALDIQSDENLCRQPLSAEELEKHIQLKKSRMAGESPPAGKGIVTAFKKMFAGKAL